jgi:hypothetical protein
VLAFIATNAPFVTACLTMNSPHAKKMYLLRRNCGRRTATEQGVSDYEPGFTYWFVANGVRLTGMPSFTHTLFRHREWQVSLLLKNANKAMPPPITQILNTREP